MKLEYIYIYQFRGVSQLSIPLSVDFNFFYNENTNLLTIEDKLNSHRTDYYKGFNFSAIVGKNGVGKSTILDFIEMMIVNKHGEADGFLVFKDTNNFVILDPNHICSRIKNSIVYDNYQDFLLSYNPKIIKVNNLSNIDSMLTFKNKVRSKHIINLSASNYKNSPKYKELQFNKITKYLTREEDNQDAKATGYAISIKTIPIFKVLDRYYEPNKNKYITNIESNDNSYNDLNDESYNDLNDESYNDLNDESYNIRHDNKFDELLKESFPRNKQDMKRLHYFKRLIDDCLQYHSNNIQIQVILKLYQPIILSIFEKSRKKSYIVKSLNFSL